MIKLQKLTVSQINWKRIQLQNLIYHIVIVLNNFRLKMVLVKPSVSQGVLL